MKNLVYIVLGVIAVMVGYMVMGSWMDNESVCQKTAEKKEDSVRVEYDSIDDLMWMEKYMYETEYPECPDDIDRDLYDVMLACLNCYDMYSDFCTYNRSLFHITMIEDEKERRKELKERNKEGGISVLIDETKNYKGTHIKNADCRNTVKYVMGEWYRFLRAKKDSIDLRDNDCEALIKRTQRRLLNIPAYKRFAGDLNDKSLERYVEKYDAQLETSNDSILIFLRDIDAPYDDATLERLSDIMDREEYSVWLPFVWKMWRDVYQFNWCGISADSTRPNWIYNKRRIQCFVTVLRYLKNHPDDTKAKTAALYLLRYEDMLCS